MDIVDFDDNFYFIKDLGYGSFGTVIFAKTKNNYKKLPSGYNVAIKLIDTKNSINETFVKVRNEINIMKYIYFIDNSCNKHIICYYDSFITNFKGVIYIAIVMEYVEGVDLQDYIDSIPKNFQRYYLPITEKFIFTYDITEKISNEEILKFMKIMAITLKFLHDKNIVHRDIKPANIMMSVTDHTLKYMDFGFSCFTSSGNELSCPNKPFLLGGPVYIAPELWKWRTNNKKPFLFSYKSSDVWSLGITFYQFLFGILPLNIENIKLYRMWTVMYLEEIIFPTVFKGDSQFIDIVKSMLKVDRSKRYTISDVVKDLEKIKY